MTLDEIVRKALTLREPRVSDILLRAGRDPIARRDGAREATDCGALGPGDIEAVAAEVLTEAEFADLRESGDAVVGYDAGPGQRVRVAFYHALGELCASVALLPARIPTLEEMGFGPEFVDAVHCPSGLSIVTGPEGSGKTTTLLAMLDHINRNSFCHILCIQSTDAVWLGEGKAGVTVREVGRDVPSFADGARWALRQDPDVVLIGEIRDLETLALALVLAETGHLVMTQMHTPDVASTIERLVSVYPAYQQECARHQMAAALRLVVAQRLIRERSGPVLAAEVMVVTSEIAKLIADGCFSAIGREMAAGSGHPATRTMGQALGDLLAGGKITRERIAAAGLVPPS